MNILVIEDDKKIATLIKKSLETDDSGYKATLSPNGTDGLALANSGAYGLIILDRGLPKMDGIAVLQTLREAGNRVPVLMLTAKNAEGKRIPQELPKAQFQGLMTMMKKGIAAAH